MAGKKKAKARKPRKLSDPELESVLKGMNRVLKNRGIAQPIKVQFAAAEAALCWKWVTETQPDGSITSHWVQVPC
jgi:hypothetical protein